MPKKAARKAPDAPRPDRHDAAQGAEYVALARAVLNADAAALCGYDARLFLSPVDDELVCSLCTNIMRKPVLIAQNTDENGKEEPWCASCAVSRPSRVG